MIRFDNVSFEYEKGKRVLDSISFTVGENEAVGLVGPNGAGKSTLMRALLGLLPAEGISVDGIAVGPKTLGQVRRKLGFVLQNSDQQMFMPTVYEDIVFGPRNYGMSPEVADRKADEVLEKLGITYLKDRYNHRISGGEKRMAAIGTVLAMDPSVLLLDEPTSALDPYNRRKIIDLMNSLPVAKIIASHDLDMIWDTCGRVILIDQGKIIADGKTEEILRDRALLEGSHLELPLRLQ